MGNTNFSIHLPRRSFDRHLTAELVLRAVRSCNIDAWVNERNDICVGPYKISFLWAVEMQLMNVVLRYPRVWFGVQDCERSSVPSRHNAHIVSARHLGQRIACLKSTQKLNSHSHWHASWTDGWLVGFDGDSRRRVSSFTSKEFTGVQSKGNS